MFDLHGQTVIGKIERRALGDGAGLQHAFHLQSKIVVQARCSVALYAKAVPRLLFDLRRRFGGFFKAPFSFVLVERHGGYCSPLVWGLASRPSKPSAARQLPATSATLYSR